ncbi:hypothetical protein QQG55_23180 [Brugia pahangi]
MQLSLTLGLTVTVFTSVLEIRGKSPVAKLLDLIENAIMTTWWSFRQSNKSFFVADKFVLDDRQLKATVQLTAIVFATTNAQTKFLKNLWLVENKLRKNF